MSEPVHTVPRPANEQQRLAALERLGITSTPTEERFDRIVRLATRLFRVPFSFISLVDDETLWIKSQEGAGELRSSREQSFCGHTILTDKAMIVPDARQDPRFSHIPLVEGDPFIRFYAGWPLEVERGCRVGSLCIMDREPRRLTETEQQLFEQLGELVEHELRLVHTLHLEDRLLESQKELAVEKRRSDELLRAILPDHVADELSRRGAVTAAVHPQVCVLFCDVTEFRTTAGQLPAEEVVRELNACFTAFDEIADQFHVDRLRTTGDGYLCVSGLVERQGTAAERVLEAGFAMRNFVEQRQDDQRRHGHDHWMLRVGIHAGPVVGGLLGGRRYAFDVWGDTVDTALRLGAAGAAGKVNVSAEFLGLVKDEVEFTPRGLRPLAGEADRPMFFIESFKAGYAST
jgi:class 3 adenylate cyclase